MPVGTGAGRRAATRDQVPAAMGWLDAATHRLARAGAWRATAAAHGQAQGAGTPASVGPQGQGGDERVLCW